MKKQHIFLSVMLLVLVFGVVVLFNYSPSMTYERASADGTSVFNEKKKEKQKVWPEVLDKQEYNRRMLALAGFTDEDFIVPEVATTTASTTVSVPEVPQKVERDGVNTTVSGSPWPTAQPYPHGGALLPFNRIVAYYGNFYSSRMGILGELEEDALIAHLQNISRQWEAADPDTPVIPAIHYITMVAQGSAGDDGMYRNVMPEDHMQKAYDMAQKIDGILFLDLQIGLSSVQRELPQYKEWMMKEDVHLALDPEFAMHNGTPPGKEIGRLEAADINFAIDWLADIVRENELPPKVLIVHRFTDNMVGDTTLIKPRPEVQVVINMDGWGSRQLKRNTYYHVLETQPLQFAGLKIFYKNDLKEPSTGIFTPTQALELHPKPIYVQYQ